MISWCLCGFALLLPPLAAAAAAAASSKRGREGEEGAQKSERTEKWWDRLDLLSAMVPTVKQTKFSSTTRPSANMRAAVRLFKPTERVQIETKGSKLVLGKMKSF